MVFIAVEAVPTGSKPPAAVVVRISTSERHGFGAAAPSSTRASSLEQGRAGVPVESLLKQVRQIGSASTCAEESSPLITRSAAAAPSVRLQVLVSVRTSSSVVRRGSELLDLGLLNAVLSLSSST